LVVWADEGKLRMEQFTTKPSASGVEVTWNQQGEQLTRFLQKAGSLSCRVVVAGIGETRCFRTSAPFAFGKLMVRTLKCWR